ncbi:MAG: hypothetical protein LUD29_01145 [Clostridia bacterium]|nr:hypothetical protein [Clostridia bacterium]
MKKTSVFLIIVVFIMSVIVITFFGKSIAFGQFQVYMTSITITNDRGNNNTISVEFSDYTQNGEYTSVWLHYVVTPDDATYKEKVEYYLTGNTYEDEEGNTKYIADVNSDGEVYFLEPGAVRAYVVTTDGSALSDDVLIICRKKNNEA